MTRSTRWMRGAQPQPPTAATEQPTAPAPPALATPPSEAEPQHRHTWQPASARGARVEVCRGCGARCVRDASGAITKYEAPAPGLGIRPRGTW